MVYHVRARQAVVCGVLQIIIIQTMLRLVLFASTDAEVFTFVMAGRTGLDCIYACVRALACVACVYVCA